MGPDDTLNSGPLPETLQIGVKFAMEAVRKGETPPKLGALDLDEYRNMCEELVPENILPQELLEKRVAYLQSTDLTKHLQPGQKICLAVLPFSPQGMPLSESDIANGLHLKMLVLDQNGKVVQGFGMHPSFIGHLLPKEITEAAFTIQDPVNKLRIVEQFRNAYGNLQNSLSLTN